MSAGESLRAGMNRSLFRSHMLMCMTFSTLHGVVDGTLAFVVAELGESLGSWSSFLLYIFFCISALFLAKPAVEIFGAKRTIQYGSRCMFCYVLSFFLAIVFRHSEGFAWTIFLTGGIVGGLGAGCLWAGQGTYFTINAQRYASLMFLEINMVTAWFASIFATMYLLMETLFKTLASVIYFAHDGDDQWLPLTFGLYTIIAIMAGEVFRINGKDMKPLQESPSQSDLAAHNNANNTSNNMETASYGSRSSGNSRDRNISNTPDTHERLAAARQDAFAVLKLVQTNTTIQLLMPYQAAFGLSTGMFAFYVNATVVGDHHGSGYIGILSAISTLTACMVAPVLGMVSSSRQHGRWYAMVIGGCCFIYQGLVVASFTAHQLSDWGSIVLLYLVHGVSRGVWECSNKEEISVAFQGTEEMPAAFATLYVTSGGVTALGYLFYQYMDRIGIGLINFFVAIAAVCSYIYYKQFHGMTRSESNETLADEPDIDTVLKLDDVALGEKRELQLGDRSNDRNNRSGISDLQSSQSSLPVKISRGRERVQNLNKNSFIIEEDDYEVASPILAGSIGEEAEI